MQANEIDGVTTFTQFERRLISERTKARGSAPPVSRSPSRLSDDAGSVFRRRRVPHCGGYPGKVSGEPSGCGPEGSAALCAGVVSVRIRYTFRGVQRRRELRSSSAPGRLKSPSVHRRRKAPHPKTYYRHLEKGAAGRRLRWPSARRRLQQRSHPRGRTTEVGNDWPLLWRFRFALPERYIRANDETCAVTGRRPGNLHFVRAFTAAITQRLDGYSVSLLASVACC